MKDLTAHQESLRQAMISARDWLRSRDLPWARQGHIMGYMVSNNYRHAVWYIEGYGVISSTLVTSNGSVWTVASAASDESHWEDA